MIIKEFDSNKLRIFTQNMNVFNLLSVKKKMCCFNYASGKCSNMWHSYLQMDLRIRARFFFMRDSKLTSENTKKTF